MRRIVITGASGFLGWHLARCLSGGNEVWGTFFKHPIEIGGCRMEQVDLTSKRRLGVVIRDASPAVILHAAAMIDVDLCEKETTQAELVNAEATGMVAELAAEIDSDLIYFSTDMVFDGLKGMYTERDKPRPINHYGKTKLAGEGLAVEKLPGCLVLRLALMYGRGNGINGSCLDWMMDGFKKGRAVKLFTDQFRTPVSVDDVCIAVERIINAGVKPGLYHLAGPERVSRYEFGERVAEVFNFQKSLISPVRMRDLKDLLPRPADNSLDCSKAERELSIKFRSVKDGLQSIAW